MKRKAVLTALFQDDPGSGQGRIRCTQIANRGHDHLTTARCEHQTDRVGEAIRSGVFGHLTGKRRERDRRFVWQGLRAATNPCVGFF